MPQPPRTDPPFRTVAIAGVGLIGGSIALALRRAWPSVRIFGIDHPEVLDAARAAGAIDDGTSEAGVRHEADVIVLAAPVCQNIALLHRLAPSLGQDTVVTDVGSTKRDILKAAQSLSLSATFVGGHPVAGAARGGIRAARADLFAGETWLFTTPAPEAALQRLEAFATGLQAIPVRIPGDVHDSIVAFTSHLPQLAITALMHVVGAAVGNPGLALAGPGLRDSSRLASSPFDVWREILTSNAPDIARALKALIETLEQVRSELADIAPSAPLAPLAPEAPKAPRDIEGLFLSASHWKRALDASAKKPGL